MTLKILGSVSAKAYVGLLASVAAVNCATSAVAQTSSSSQGSSVTLPPVIINAPKPRVQSRNASRRERAAARTTRQAVNRPSHGSEAAPRSETVASKGTFQQGNGPIQGYVAHRTLVGTKTNTPILEIPQAISVVGREQIRDQGARTVVQALGYTAGGWRASVARPRGNAIKLRQTLLLQSFPREL